MSSFRKALKSKQRNHHERSQPADRKHLGLLEKKKDYKLRANDYHKKQDFLAALRKKAMDKNPDEFYYKMISSKLQDGEHVAKKPKWEEEVTEEQRKVMRTQDVKYVEMKRVAEAKKIERMKAELHLLEAEGKEKNKHTFFVDNMKEVQSFDLAEQLQTAPQLLGRVFNRPRLHTLETQSVGAGPRAAKALFKLRQRQYSLLAQRIDREKKMFVISQKIQTRKDLQDKRRKIKVKQETTNSAAVYKFASKRKR